MTLRDFLSLPSRLVGRFSPERLRAIGVVLGLTGSLLLLLGVLRADDPKVRDLWMIPVVSIVSLLSLNWTAGIVIAAYRAESYERGRRIGAESIAVQLQQRIAENSQRESQAGGDPEDECPNCRANYALGFKAAALVAEEAASNLQSDVPAQRSRHLKLVDQGRGTD